MQTLEEAVQAIGQFCHKANVAAEAAYRINLVCEELVVNLLTHGQASDFSLSLSTIDDGFKIELSYGGKHFNPVESDKGPLQSIENSKAGGLGLFLVKQLARNINYRYENGVNFVEVTV
jgi:anti-sigma regulatory factor (Ser/Thr protein kinase)